MFEKTVDGDIITIRTTHGRILTLLQSAINARIEMNNRRKTEKDVNFAEYCERENESLEEYLKVINS
ncbi:hypothetical protein [Tissierella pigra]|uniref:Uncharacterized protein n=1 Tax=Tissierella pigra TaxID=2607614 RepID=A0A6N7XYQ0_9FIRM|nr:hypothetical protein [Tissierella pigra]MSU01378.1 hypothetical protein [Tissierella pigra]